MSWMLICYLLLKIKNNKRKNTIQLLFHVILHVLDAAVEYLDAVVML